MRHSRNLVLSLVGASIAAALVSGCGGSPGATTPSAGSAVTPKLQPALRPRTTAFTTIFSFNGTDGQWPQAPSAQLTMDPDGALYGTTFFGGYQGGYCAGAGCGTVFKLTPSGSTYTESVLHKFTDKKGDGSYPHSALLEDTNGNLYGTTYGGTGPGSCCGTVYKLTPSGSGYTYTIIYSFQESNDGRFPSGALAIDGNGTLYGTTIEGGSNTCGSTSLPVSCGTVFKLTPTASGYAEKLIYNFNRPPDGYSPTGGVALDQGGNVYGTTFLGGKNPPGWCSGVGSGCGTIFKLTPSGSTYKETILHYFKGINDTKTSGDGALPTSLTLGPSGVFYGVTGYGGKTCLPSEGLQCGAIFKLTPSGSKYVESVLHRFKATDGFPPNGPLLIIGSKIYGTTNQDGPTGSNYGYGTVFKMTTSGKGYKVLYAFSLSGWNMGNGIESQAGVVENSDGTLFGTTRNGGAYESSCQAGCGTVFRLQP